MKHLGLLLSCATLGALASPLAAQDTAAPAATSATGELNLERSDNATVNLVRLLVQQGVIPRDAAVELIRQAEAEARQARAQTAAVTAAASEIRAAAQAELALSESDVRVTYVPEHVRQEIAADVRNELAAEARAQGLASPGKDTPSWVSRFRPFGDLRVRGQASFYDEGNNTTGAFPDFNAINTGSPFDVAGSVFSPQLNSDQDRDQFNLRARFGFETDLDEGYIVGIRLATGNSASPVSTNQTVGSPGNFSRYSIWIDQAFLRWESRAASDFSAKVYAGRFENPFYKTDITWDSDIQLDGFAFQGGHQTTESIKTFFTAGFFPVFNTALNFPANQPDKFESTDRYLSAAQLGADYQITKNTRLKAALAYYYFSDIQGELSAPFTPLNASDAGSTDSRRPTFAQKGNTYMPLRDIVPTPANNFGAINQFQYFGLASDFAPAAFTAQLDLNHYEPFQISFFTEAVKNLAYDKTEVEASAVNNLSGTGGHLGGDFAWTLGVNVGQAVLQERGDWRIGLSYRYQESDSFVDGFVDSDFGLGGTNLQGYIIGAQYTLTPRIFLSARWLSASEVDGPAFSADLFQFDVNSRF